VIHLAIELMVGMFLKIVHANDILNFFAIFIPITLFETQTNALPTLMAVMSMLSVVTPMHLTLAHVKLDMLEMADLAVVR